MDITSNRLALSLCMLGFFTSALFAANQAEYEEENNITTREYNGGVETTVTKLCGCRITWWVKTGSGITDPETRECDTHKAR